MLQIFVWTRGSFSLLQTLDVQGDILSVAPVTGDVVPRLLVCVDGQNVSCVLLRWTNRRFQTPQPLKLNGRVLQAEVINTRVDETLLLVGIEGDVLLSIYKAALVLLVALDCNKFNPLRLNFCI